MNNENGFDLLISVVSSIIPQLGGLETKYQDLVISFQLDEGETIPKFYLRALQIKSENFLLKYKIGKINNLMGKYILELSKLKQLQQYMNTFELDYNVFERLPQINQLYNAFTYGIEEVSETLFTADIDMTTSHSMIEPIVNRNFGNTFQHQNGINQRQQTHKKNSQQC